MTGRAQTFLSLVVFAGLLFGTWLEWSGWRPWSPDSSPDYRADGKLTPRARAR